MKYLIILIVFSNFLISCDNSNSIESIKMREQIIKLQKRNEELENSIKKINEQEIPGRALAFGVPLKDGNKNIMRVLVHHFKIIPEYKIVRFEGEKEILIGKSDKTYFDYEYIPKLKENKDSKIYVKFSNGKDKYITIPVANDTYLNSLK